MTNFQFKRHLAFKIRQMLDNPNQDDHLQHMRNIRSFLEENLEHLPGGETEMEFILDIISMTYHFK